MVVFPVRGESLDGPPGHVLATPTFGIGGSLALFMLVAQPMTAFS